MWQTVDKKIIRQGKEFWSARGFRPTHKDIRKILSLSRGELTHVCRVNKNILIFCDNEFIEEGIFFPAPNNPQFATEKDAEYLYWMEKLGAVTLKELAKICHPGMFAKGKAFRIKGATHLWAPTRKDLANSYEGEIEKYDFGKYAIYRTRTFLKKAEIEGWIIKEKKKKYKILS